MRHDSRLVRSALLAGGVAYGALACQQKAPSHPPSQAPLVASEPGAADAPSTSAEVAPVIVGSTETRASAETRTRESPAANGADPALFLRLGDALLPLGCKRARAWRAGEACIAGKGEKELTLHPRLSGEADVSSASPASVPFMLGGAAESGLLLVEEEREGAGTDRPLLGFATARTQSPVRFAHRAAGHIREEAKAWCEASEGACRGVTEKTLVELPQRRWRAEQKQEVLGLVRAATATLADSLAMEVSAGFDLELAGSEQRVLMVEVSTGNLPVEKAAKLNLPPRLHYLLAKTATGFRRLDVVREEDLGLGESGELVGAIDLDADGTDELIVEWRYSEGRSWQLLRREQEHLVVVGGFTDGA
jgi:hypothetical protein